MNLKEILTPKDTEEVRPGIFLQRRESGEYRIVKPIVWKGEWKLKQQFSLRNLFMIILVLFIAWSYFEETEYCRQLQENPCEILPNITSYCFSKNFNIVDDGKREDTITIQDYP